MVSTNLMQITQVQVVTKTIRHKNVKKTADRCHEVPTLLGPLIIQPTLGNILSVSRPTRQMICVVGTHLKYMVKAVCTPTTLLRAASLLL